MSHRIPDSVARVGGSVLVLLLSPLFLIDFLLASDESFGGVLVAASCANKSA